MSKLCGVMPAELDQGGALQLLLSPSGSEVLSSPPTPSSQALCLPLSYVALRLLVSSSKAPGQEVPGAPAHKDRVWEGTVPVRGPGCSADLGYGVLLGEQLVTMSCTDKIAR